MSKHINKDYIKNINSESIIYFYNDNSYLEITKEQYLKENPDCTEEDFNELKELSDGLYRTEASKERSQQRTVKKVIKEKSKEKAMTSLDELLEEKEEIEKIREVVDKLISSGKLSETQKRRFLKHYYRGKSYRQIATEEGVSHIAIFKSVNASRKKLKKFFEMG